MIAMASLISMTVIHQIPMPALHYLADQQTVPQQSCSTVVNEGDGAYWLDPDGSGAQEYYCDFTTDGGTWVLIADIDSPYSNFNNSQPIGTFNAGTIGSPGYSIDTDVFVPIANGSFDIMI